MCLLPQSEESRRERGAIRETRGRGGRDGQTRWSSTSLESKNGRGSVSESRVRRDTLPEHQVSLLSLLDSRSICFGDVPLRSGIHPRENVYRWPLGHEEENTVWNALQWILPVENRISAWSSSNNIKYSIFHYFKYHENNSGNYF